MQSKLQSVDRKLQNLGQQKYAAQPEPQSQVKRDRSGKRVSFTDDIYPSAALHDPVVANIAAGGVTAWCARAGLTVYPPSRTFEPFGFDE